MKTRRHTRFDVTLASAVFFGLPTIANAVNWETSDCPVTLSGDGGVSVLSTCVTKQTKDMRYSEEKP
jgi:hypothetical protein